MMDITDAKKVIENLQTRPFICSDDSMILDNGYVIMLKEDYDKLKQKQMPKKPKEKIVLVDNTKFSVGICPNCGNKTNSDFKHCEYCGQALDWSDKS